MLASYSRRGVLLAAVLALSANAYAQQPGAGAEPVADARAPVVQSSTPQRQQTPAQMADPEFAAPADDALLDQSRGGDDRTIIDTRFSGNVNGNSATNISTGWNIIEGGSFANMTGIPIIIQNSGANVLIQNATVINLQLQ